MLEIRDLSKRIGDFYLRDINLEIKEGEYFVILGTTGAGKTLLLETIAGKHIPDKGEIIFRGQRLNNLYPEQRGIGFVYQDYALFPHLTVKENIVFPLTVRKMARNEIKNRLHDIMKMMNLENLSSRYPSTLSGGEQQRVAIARALIISPELLLLDEPLSSLDPRTKEIFQEELRRVHSLVQPAILHITHDFNEGLALAERIGVMHDGTIVQVGSPEEIFRQPKSPFIAQFVGMNNIFSGLAKENEIMIKPGIIFRPVTEKTGHVTCAVRPEDIILSKENFSSSARNYFKGSIASYVNGGQFMKIVVDIGIPLTVMITTQSFHRMNLKVQDTVWATFKSSAIHIF